MAEDNLGEDLGEDLGGDDNTEIVTFGFTLDYDLRKVEDDAEETSRVEARARRRLEEFLQKLRRRAIAYRLVQAQEAEAVRAELDAMENAAKPAN